MAGLVGALVVLVLAGGLTLAVRRRGSLDGTGEADGADGADGADSDRGATAERG